MSALRPWLEGRLIDWGLPEILAAILLTMIVIIIWIIAGMIISTVSRSLVNRHFIKRKGDRRGKTLGGLVGSALKVVIWFVVLLAIVDEFGFEITPILASAGILGLAIGFGAQSLVKDVVSGFFLVVENAFNVGDTVEVNGFRGTVREMNLRVTHVENFMGALLIVNNGQISTMINWSRNNSAAIVDFGVAYGSDLEKIAKIMPIFMEKLQSLFEEIVETPAFSGITGLADSSINMRIFAKCNNGTHFALERKIRFELVKHLNEHSIEIPFPQLVVHQN